MPSKVKPAMILRMLLVLFALGAIALPTSAQQSISRRPLITQAIDERQLVTLVGNTRREAREATAAVIVVNTARFDHIQMLLRRSPAQERAAETFVDGLTRSGSSSYHKWLTAVEFGKRFGATDADVQKITTWLRGQGFVVNQVYPNRMMIDFSGNAGQVSRAFHTHIRRFESGGVMHVGNDSDPQFRPPWRPRSKGLYLCTISILTTPCAHGGQTPPRAPARLVMRLARATSRRSII